MAEALKMQSLEPAVFRLKSRGADGVLVGSRCSRCQRVFFPARRWCAACYEPTCDEVELSGEGVLESFALVDRKQAYCLIELPYVLGEVLLTEGIHIYTTINVSSSIAQDGSIKVGSATSREKFDRLKRGQRAWLAPVVIKKAEDGSSVVAYNFNVAEAL